MEIWLECSKGYCIIFLFVILSACKQEIHELKTYHHLPLQFNKFDNLLFFVIYSLL